MEHHSGHRIDESETAIENLECLRKNINFAVDCMLHKVKHEDATIFIGSTKSGKSTLINYLIGNRLVGEKVSEFMSVSIKKLDDPTNTRGPKIGAGPTSDTIVPSRWNSRQPLGHVLWDVPGFDDNRGVVQDISNAFHVYELLKNLKSAKIVLVTDINDIVHDNIRPFLNLLNSVEKLLKEKIRECFPAISIIFSKVPKDISDVPADKNNISKLLNHQFLSSSSIDISEAAKDLVRHFIQHNQKIGIFKRAILGNVTDAVINEGIFEAIESADSISGEILKQLSPSIADVSKIFLYKVRDQLCSTQIFEELNNCLTRLFCIPVDAMPMCDAMGIAVSVYKKVVPSSVQGFLTKVCVKDSNLMITNDKKNTKEALHIQLEKLHYFKYNLLQAVESNTFDERIATIRMIHPSVEHYIDEHNLLQAVELMRFCDQLLNLRESKQFDTQLKDLLTTALAHMSQLMININLELALMNKEEAERQSAELTREYKKDRDRLLEEIESVKRHNKEMSVRLQEEAKETGIYFKLGYKSEGTRIPLIGG